MKSVSRAVANDVWSASVSRRPDQIYAKDREAQKERSQSWKPDSLRINADRISRGEPVGVDYLWGRRAAQMIKLKLIRPSSLENYRQDYLEEIQKLYSEHFYSIKIKELEDKHDHAMRLYDLT